MTLPRSYRQRFWYASAIALLGVLVLATAYREGLAFVRRQGESLRATRQELATITARHEALTGATRAFGEVAAARALLGESLVNPAEPLAFIETIEALGRRAEVLVEFAPGGDSGGRGAYTLVASGSLDRVLAFLLRLERAPFLVTFGDAELVRSSAVLLPSRGRPDDAPTGVRLTLTLSVPSL